MMVFPISDLAIYYQFYAKLIEIRRNKINFIYLYNEYLFNWHCWLQSTKLSLIFDIIWKMHTRVGLGYNRSQYFKH